MSNEAVIQCSNLKMTFDDAGSPLEILHGINFQVEVGGFVSIVGNSGSGKSTFLQLLAGLESPSFGSVTIAGQRIDTMNKTERAAFRRDHLGFIYQLHHLLPEFSAAENVAMPLLLKGIKKSLAIETAKVWLDKVGLSHRFHHRPNALSGGERQRVAIARALVAEPVCVFADEPTGNLDTHNANQIQDLMLELSELGTCFVVVTHDTAFSQRAKTQYLMTDGCLEVLEK